MVRFGFCACVLLALGMTISSHAAETIKYTYDARGRVIKVERTGTVNNGVTTTYEHDRANNRRRTTTTGSPNPVPPQN